MAESLESNLVARRLGRVLLVRQNEEPPTTRDWKAFLDEIKAMRPEMKQMRAMVFSDGGGPTAEQRKQLATVLAGAEILTAVICDQAVVRFVVATISLFNKSMRTYAWSDVNTAYSWLNLTQDERRQVGESIENLSLRVRSRRTSEPVMHSWM